jgi:hypothetical protein
LKSFTARSPTTKAFTTSPTSLPALTKSRPAAPAYVVAEGNSARGGKSVIVAEDEQVEDINFSMVRGGVITGKVTDADNRPLVAQQVYLYRAADFQHNRCVRSLRL